MKSYLTDGDEDEVTDLLGLGSTKLTATEHHFMSATQIGLAEVAIWKCRSRDALYSLECSRHGYQL